MSGLEALFAYTHIWHNAKMPSAFLLLAAKEIIYYTLNSLSVFSLAKNLELMLELGMISKSNIKLCSLRRYVCRYFLQNNVY